MASYTITYRSARPTATIVSGRIRLGDDGVLRFENYNSIDDTVERVFKVPAIEIAGIFSPDGPVPNLSAYNSLPPTWNPETLVEEDEEW